MISLESGECVGVSGPFGSRIGSATGHQVQRESVVEGGKEGC